jgi:hypothetical protein
MRFAFLVFRIRCAGDHEGVSLCLVDIIRAESVSCTFLIHTVLEMIRKYGQVLALVAKGNSFFGTHYKTFQQVSII